MQDLRVERVKVVGALGEIQRIIDTKRYVEAYEVATYLDDLVLNGCLDSSPLNIRLFTGKLELQGVREILEKSLFA